MGFLKKLKKVFNDSRKKDGRIREESVEDLESLSLEEIESRLRTKEKEIQDSLDNSVSEMYDKILPILDKLEEDITALEEKDISKIRDDPRLKNITEIGRKDFLHQSRELKEKLMRKKSGEEAIFYINAEIKKFIKYSHMSYIKTTQLIGEEAKKVRDDITEIIKIEESLLDVSLNTTKHREEIKRLIRTIEDFKEERNKIEDFKKRIEETRATITAHRGKISGIEGEVEKIKLSQKFKESEEVEEELKRREEELTKEENEIKVLIDSKLLEKNLYYEKDKGKIKRIEEYLKDTTGNLLEDRDLAIYDILEDTRKRIIDKQIVVKDYEKVLKKAVLKREDLSKIRNSLISLKKEITTLKKRLEVMNLGLDKLEVERLDLLNKTHEKEDVLNSLVKKEYTFEEEFGDKEEKIRLEFGKII